MSSVIKKYTSLEEVFNSLSHGIGVVFGVFALVFMIVKSNLDTDSAIKIVSVSIYGASMIILFLASTLYHAVSFERLKAHLKTLDHCAIYLLIAGTYTPFLMISIQGTLGWVLMILIWTLALFGIIFKAKFKDRYKKISLMSYLVMGWLSVFIIYELSKTLPPMPLYLLALGGVVYSLGVIFYVADKKIAYNHAIWHLFVIGGCVSHFFAIYVYVL